LDFGSTGIKAVELAHTWQGYRVTNYGFYPTAQKRKTREKLQILQKISRAGAGDGVCRILPAHRMMVHGALPSRKKKNQQVIKFESRICSFPVNQVIVDFTRRKKVERESSHSLPRARCANLSL
jgi:hypothetical protein